MNVEGEGEIPVDVTKDQEIIYKFQLFLLENLDLTQDGRVDLDKFSFNYDEDIDKYIELFIKTNSAYRLPIECLQYFPNLFQDIFKKQK